MKNNILVTGGAGFIGTNLIKRLITLNYKIYSLDDYSTGSIKNEHVSDLVTYIKGDIDEIRNIDGALFDRCFHLAAQSRVQPSFENPKESFKTNVHGTLKVMEWAKKNNVKVIYAGSSSKHYNPSDSPYAMTKFQGEEICKLYREHYNVDAQIARFYNVYGPSEPIDIKYGNVIGIWRAKLISGDPLPIVGDGRQRRDFTHVDDIVDGIIKISESNLYHDDAWELGTGVNYSINELFQMFKKKFNVNCIHIDDQVGNYRKTIRINDDMLEKLNWSPKDRLYNYIQNLKIL